MKIDAMTKIRELHDSDTVVRGENMQFSDEN